MKDKNEPALLVKPTDGESYSEAVHQIKHAVRHDEMGASIKAVRQTRAGGLLVEFEPDATSKGSFRDAAH